MHYKLLYCNHVELYLLALFQNRSIYLRENVLAFELLYMNEI